MPCVSRSSCWLPASLMRRHRNRASAKRGAKLEPSLSTKYLSGQRWFSTQITLHHAASETTLFEHVHACGSAEALHVKASSGCSAQR